MLTTGTTLGPYEILGSLGTGGMGEVYRARDPRLGRDVALKVLSPLVAHDAASLERFIREARAVAALNHPHIVTIYSTEESEGHRFLTMELVDGQTLDATIPEEGLPVARFLEIGMALADALTAAHQKQIIHRDLKPGNVMITPDGRVKVLDFGLARMGESHGADPSSDATQPALTREGAIVGTFPYMSPEQVTGDAIDHRTDLFSLGIIYYEMLAGRRPFKGDTSVDLVTAILRDAPPPIRQRRPEIPESVARVIGRLLEKRPDDRVQTARDVFNELREVKRTLESAAAPSSGTHAPWLEQGASIAVLPFADLSAEKDQDWFCDGVAEEILNALAQLPGLRVAARTSAFSFRGRAEDLCAIAEKLRVRTVLEGSVRRAGDRVRITAQLSDATNGFQLWSERYDRHLKDIFDVQDEIARTIAERLRITLSGLAGGRLVERPTSNLEAYELLLKGRTLHLRRGPAILEGLVCFERAAQLDPSLAEAHALVGDSLRLVGLYALAPPTEVIPRARLAADRALAIDPCQVEALATLASISAIYDWDIQASLGWTNRALACDPRHVRALAESAIVLASLEHIPPDLERRITQDASRARQIDPLNAWAAAVEGFTLGFAGRLTDSLAAARDAKRLDASNFTARWILTSMLHATGSYDEALAEGEQALAVSARNPRMLAVIAGIHAASREPAAADTLFQELSQRARTSYVGWTELATAAASAGHVELARQHLAAAIEGREASLLFWKLPGWDALKADPEAMRMLRNTVIQ